jgi:hypothetical protein
MQAIKRQLLLKSSHISIPASSRPFSTLQSRFTPSMTTGTFQYIDRASFVDSEEPFVKPWAKVDGPGFNFRKIGIKRSVENLRGQESQFSVNTSGFAVYKSPANEKSFTDDQAVRKGYYEEVEQLLREKLPGVKKVVIFDHVGFTCVLRAFALSNKFTDYSTKRQIVTKTASPASSRRSNTRSSRSPSPTPSTTKRGRRTFERAISTHQRMEAHRQPSNRFPARRGRLAYHISQRFHQSRSPLPQATSRGRRA